jgi:hypothetical protein
MPQSIGRGAVISSWPVLADNLPMSPTATAFLQTGDPATIRETGKVLLVLASLLTAVGRLGDAARAVSTGVEMLEHAARLQPRA